MNFDANPIGSAPSGAGPSQARRPQLEEHRFAAVEARPLDERNADRGTAGPARAVAACATVRTRAARCARPREATCAATVAVADRTRAGATVATHATSAALSTGAAHAAAARSERRAISAHEHPADHERG